MKRRLALLRFHLIRLGWPAWLGSALIVFALGLDFLATMPMEIELENARQAARLVPPVARSERLSQSRLPAGIELGQDDMAKLEMLFQAAQAADIDLSQGDYGLETSGDGGARRLQIQLPVRAGYPALRHFLADSLNRVPTLALENLRLQRKDSNQAELDARVQFVLFLGPAR